MAKSKKKVMNIPDFKNDKGLWVKSLTVTQGDFYIEYQTRGCSVYNGLITRCKELDKNHPKNGSYYNKTSAFSDFQDFTGWAVEQKGYMEKDLSGYFWQLDKDILIPGNTEYSRDACAFVPAKLNSVLIDKAANRGEYPLGVHLHKPLDKFAVRCQDGFGGRTHLGYFTTALSAHRAWQLKKAEVIENVVYWYLSLTGSRQDVAYAMFKRAVKLRQDAGDGKETVKL